MDLRFALEHGQSRTGSVARIDVPDDATREVAGRELGFESLSLARTGGARDDDSDRGLAQEIDGHERRCKRSRRPRHLGAERVESGGGTLREIRTIEMTGETGQSARGDGVRVR